MSAGEGSILPVFAVYVPDIAIAEVDDRAAEDAVERRTLLALEEGDAGAVRVCTYVTAVAVVEAAIDGIDGGPHLASADADIGKSFDADVADVVEILGEGVAEQLAELPVSPELGVVRGVAEGAALNDHVFTSFHSRQLISR